MCLQEEGCCNPEQQEPDNEKQDFLRLKEAACCWKSKNEDEADFLAFETRSISQSEGVR